MPDDPTTSRISVPDMLPSWARSGDWLVVRAIAVWCLFRMLGT